MKIQLTYNFIINNVPHTGTVEIAVDSMDDIGMDLYAQATLALQDAFLSWSDVAKGV